MEGRVGLADEGASTAADTQLDTETQSFQGSVRHPKSAGKIDQEYIRSSSWHDRRLCKPRGSGEMPDWGSEVWVWATTIELLKHQRDPCGKSGKGREIGSGSIEWARTDQLANCSMLLLKDFGQQAHPHGW